LVIAGCVGGASQAGEVCKACTSNPVGDRFEGELEGVEEEAKVGGLVGRLVEGVEVEKW